MHILVMDMNLYICIDKYNTGSGQVDEYELVYIDCGQLDMNHVECRHVPWSCRHEPLAC